MENDNPGVASRKSRVATEDNDPGVASHQPDLVMEDGDPDVASRQSPLASDDDDPGVASRQSPLVIEDDDPGVASRQPRSATEDDDPVVAEYDVFITPELQQQLLVLQYINRPPDQPFTKATGSHPTEVRIKPESGFIEVDVPIDIHQNYNRPQGVKWGEAMRKTKEIGQKAYGAAAGFERAMPRLNSRPGAAADAPPANAIDNDNIDEYVANFEDANEKGHVLNTQTYGGQIMKPESSAPRYMVGTFRDNQLHLTKVDGVVQMRTQFPYLDATAQLEAVNRRREKESQEGAKPTEPKAFLPTVKKTGGDTSAELTQDFYKKANQEKWVKLQYFDEDSEAAYEAYNDRLFVKDTSAAPKLHSSMTNAQYLDAISAPSKKKKPSKRQEETDVAEALEGSDFEKAKEKTGNEPIEVVFDVPPPAYRSVKLDDNRWRKLPYRH